MDDPRPSPDSEAGEPGAELTPFSIIRTETVFSRLPVHNLSKNGRVDIRIVRKNDSGEVDLKWEVSFSDRYGQAGQLAYKVETLIINRRIEEASRPLARTIRLGSLAQICRELGVPASGKNIRDLRNSIHQNAGAYITARLRYRGVDGSERRVEAGFTRYAVVFTGETLPDGGVADGVYIILNDPYRDVLNTAPVRPLNYEYLKELRPTPQRFYEIISFRIFGALHNGRTTARMAYSEYCLYSAQQRQLEPENFRIQMYKVHKPHLDSGYLENVSYQALTDESGQRDWILTYTAGPRAKAEYEAFARKQSRLPADPAKQSDDAHDDALTAQLIQRGIAEAKARELVRNAGAAHQRIQDQIEWGDMLLAQAKPGAFRNPPGFYVSLIRDNIEPPASFETSRMRSLREQAEQQAMNQQQAEFAYDQYRRSQVDHALRAMPPEALEDALKLKRKHYHRLYPALPPERLEDVALSGLRHDVENTLDILTFDAFRRKAPDRGAGKDLRA